MASLIVAIALAQPASDGAAGRLPAVPKGPATLESRVRDLKEVNYYPAAGGWTYMWSRFDPTAIDRDFARIRALGANTVRIFIQPAVFGFPTVRPVMADRLSEVIGLAAKHSLRVHLTLFDWWSRYTDIDGSKEWVSSLLSRYRDDPRIAVVELQNEIYPQNHEAVAWVTTMLPYLSTVLPGTLRTVFVASVPPEVFALFIHELKSSPPDFWDYHYYGPSGDAYSLLSRIKALAGPRPLFRWRNRLQHGRQRRAAKRRRSRHRLPTTGPSSPRPRRWDCPLRRRGPSMTSPREPSRREPGQRMNRPSTAMACSS